MLHLLKDLHKLYLNDVKVINVIPVTFSNDSFNLVSLIAGKLDLFHVRTCLLIQCIGFCHAITMLVYIAQNLRLNIKSLMISFRYIMLPAINMN